MAHPYMAIQQRANRKMNGAHVETPKRPIVFWTTEEKTVLARTVRELRAADPGITNLEAVRLAQEKALPAARNRPLAQERQIADIIALMRDIALQEKAAEPSLEPLKDAVMRAVMVQADINAIIGDSNAPSPVHNARRPTHDEIRADQQEMIATRIANPVPEKTRKPFVRWTQDERRKIAVESKRLLNSFENMGRLEAIRKAIEYHLPADRQREIDAFSNVPWIEAEWKQIDDQAHAEREAREAREHAAEVERQAEESKRATEAARAEAEKAKAIDPASLPLETLIGALGTRIAGMLLRSIGEQLQDSIMQRITEALGHLPMPSHSLPEGVRLHAAPRDRKPRVLIVGLIRQQEDDLRHALGDILRLEFSKADAHSELEDKARNADLVVLMTKFISHKHQDTVKRVNEHFVFRNGGVSELKRYLTQWINGEVMTATA